VGNNPGDLDPDGHGTCVASIACSNIGIMIKGTLVSMGSCYSNGGLIMSSIFRAFGMAIIDIETKGRQGRSVINISLSKSIIYKMTFILIHYIDSPQIGEDSDEENKLQFEKLLKDAEGKGIVVVAAAGNDVGTVTFTRRSTLYELTI
jgi:subtilase family protein